MPEPPVIGLSTGRRNRPVATNVPQHADLGCDIMYPICVERAGGVPVLLPRSSDDAVMAAAMARVDALLLTGGGDVVSLAYGEEPHPKSFGQDPVRDAAEFAAIRIALERGLPVLGICRGIQSLNVALGGTLVQDVLSAGRRRLPALHPRERDRRDPHDRRRAGLAAGARARRHERRRQ